MRPDASATVRLHPEGAANEDILVVEIGSLVRLILLATAWVGVKLVSEFDYTPRDRSDTSSPVCRLVVVSISISCRLGRRSKRRREVRGA